MDGGSCEATAFGAYGYRATSLSLPLGNYHNMVDIDGVRGGSRPARVAPEFVSLDDFHGLIELLAFVAPRLGEAGEASLLERLDAIYRIGAPGPRLMDGVTTHRSPLISN